MSLRDDLLAKGSALVDDKGAGWLDKAEERARKELPDLVRETSKLLPDGVTVTEDQAGEVLDKLAQGKRPLLRAGKVGFAWLVANLESGEEQEARLRYLETEATFAERRAAMQAAGDGAFDEAKERADSWEEFKEFMADVGEVGLKVLVVVARKALGI